MPFRVLGSDSNPDDYTWTRKGVSRFYLSGRGLKGDSFIILEANRNQDVMASYASEALDALKRGVILGTNTRVDLLTDEERRRHESLLEKLAARMIFCKRTKTVLRTIEKDHKELLSDSESEN